MFLLVVYLGRQRRSYGKEILFNSHPLQAVERADSMGSSRSV